MADIATLSERIRRFNRFYTGEIGVLQEGLLESPFSLAEARVLYEIAHGDGATAAAIGKGLRLDPGYLSRIVKTLRGRGLLKQVATEDRRARSLALTPKGRRAFERLDRRSHDDIAAKLERLAPQEQEQLAVALESAQRLLGGAAPDRTPFVLRPHRPGDMGWVVQRHGEVYAQEYGWDEQFEALVAEIAAHFIQHFDPKRERCWIAERGGERLGSVFLVRKSAAVAKLRLLLVEPQARGLGLGKRLVQECLVFAKQAGYRKVTLWTNSGLTAARRIYESEGFALLEEMPNRDFGPELTAQTWEKRL